MSSHHIVKDQQEPALIIDQWESSYNLLLVDLLEWLPQIICFEPIIEKIVSLGIKIDTIVVEPNNREKWIEKISDQLPVGVIQAEKNTFLSTTMAHLIAKGHRDVNILTDEHSQILMVNAVASFTPIDVIVYSGRQKTIIYKEHSFRKWMTKDEHIKLWAPVDGWFSTSGFHQHLVQEIGKDFLLDVKEDGLITIESEKVPFLLTQEL